MIERVFGDTPDGGRGVLAQDLIGRMGGPDETASAVLWRCSDDASSTTGAAPVVDGDQTI